MFFEFNLMHLYMYIRYNISLSDNQKSKLAKALMNKYALVLRLSFSKLSGSDELFLTKTQIGKIQKAKTAKKGVDLKISKTQISHVVKKGGSLFTSLMQLGTKMIPMATKMVTKLLSGVATGAVGALMDFGVSKALGSGVSNNQKGGFLIPQDKINQLIAHKNLLTKSRKNKLYHLFNQVESLLLSQLPNNVVDFWVRFLLALVYLCLLKP